MIKKFINFIIKLFLKSDTIKLVRFHDDSVITLGKLFIDDKVFYTCEPAWENNKRKISCIPSGVYDIEIIESKKFGQCIWVKDVPNRSGILIHQGNTKFDTEGCILIGTEVRVQIYNKKHNEYAMGVINSQKAKREMLELIKKGNKKKIRLIN